MDTDGVIQLSILFILILLSGYFVSVGTAFTTVSRINMRNLEESGNPRAGMANKILDRYGKMLTAFLICRTLVIVSASSLAASFVIRFLGNAYIGIAIGLLTFIILLAGEIIPKTRASLKAEKIVLTYSYLVYYLMKLLTPVIFIVDALTNGILRLIHIDPTRKSNTITESELKVYVDVSHKDGQIETEERKMIYNVFAFSDICARDIMIPRLNMVTISSNDSCQELLAIFKESLYTRIPVYQEDKDDMLGFINIKDFFLARENAPGDKEFSLQPLIREAYYTYEYKKSADLLFEMREKSMHIAFVLNEYGSTVGMITLEDLLEELVGEIRDEYDEDENELIQKIRENTYLIEGSMNLSDINDAIGTKLDSEDYDSIGGIIIGQLSRLPEDEETVALEDGTLLQVKGIDQNRILQVLMTLPETKIPENDTDTLYATEKIETESAAT